MSFQPYLLRMGFGDASSRRLKMTESLENKLLKLTWSTCPTHFEKVLLKPLTHKKTAYKQKCFYGFQITGLYMLKLGLLFAWSYIKCFGLSLTLNAQLHILEIRFLNS